MIEANAGTGKTYTIEGLFIRLLLEKELTMQQILVVTFTRKATAELQNRILDKMRQAVRMIKSGQADPEEIGDAFLKDLFLHRRKYLNEDLTRLQEAIHDFDEAKIFTIHGYCQRVLNEEVLLTGMPFDVRIHQDDPLTQQATEDYWRRFIQESSQSEEGKVLIESLHQDGVREPADLEQRIRMLINKPYAHIADDLKPIEEYLKAIRELSTERIQLLSEWQTRKNELLEKIAEADLNNLGSWKKKLDLVEADLEIDSPFEELTALKVVRRSYLDTKIKKNGNAVVQDDFFERCDGFFKLREMLELLPAALIVHAYVDIQSKRENLLTIGDQITFQDLLMRVQKALQHPESGPKLAERLRTKTPYALVDEFQDTDPVQFDIFQRIYDSDGTGSSLMMIGDPKQSIYGFRGADIFTYLQAKEENQRRGEQGEQNFVVLKNNFRSRPSLIKAVNALFQFKENPFLLHENEGFGASIDYFPSVSGNPGIEEELLLDGAPPTAMHVKYAGPGRNKSKVKFAIYRDLAKEIQRLLTNSKNGSLLIRKNGKDVPVQAGDIAILVLSNYDASVIKKVLKEAGIGAVTYSRDTVFETAEADAMYAFMNAVLNPGHLMHGNRLILSGLMGYDLNELEGVMKNDEQRIKLAQELEDLEKKWRTRGFLAAFRQFLVSGRRMEKIAETYDAERVLTNLFHLADICSKVERDQSMLPYALNEWFARQQSDPDQDDERTLLLESDQNLVKISTVHVSKGLEFPIVFCPTLWDGKDLFSSKSAKNPKEVHTDGKGKIYLGGKATIPENIQTQIRKEAVAEQVRLAYVAVTRAKYLCYLYFHENNRSTHYSGLASLLTDPEGRLNRVDYASALKQLAETSPEEIRLEQVVNHTGEEADLGTHGMGSLPDFIPKKYEGREVLKAQRGQFSFSSLVHGGRSEEPDHDQVFEKYFGDSKEEQVEMNTDHPIHLPRGMTIGSFIHAIFEDPNFHFHQADHEDVIYLIQRQMQRFRVDMKWEKAVQNIVNWVCRARIGDLLIGDLKPGDQLRELEFHFPVRKPDSQTLFSLIREEESMPTDSVFRRDLMKGFIDLVARKNGKYYIIDYKSNYLGGRKDDYHPDALKKAVLESGYDLQYSIYLVALIRYLRPRIPNFNIEDHIGGVGYLFVRGLDPAFGEGYGVYFCKPVAKTLEQIDKELRRPIYSMDAV